MTILVHFKCFRSQYTLNNQNEMVRWNIIELMPGLMDVNFEIIPLICEITIWRSVEHSLKSWKSVFHLILRQIITNFKTEKNKRTSFFLYSLTMTKLDQLVRQCTSSIFFQLSELHINSHTSSIGRWRIQTSDCRFTQCLPILHHNTNYINDTNHPL